MRTQKIHGGEQHATAYNVMYHHNEGLKPKQTITHFLQSQTLVSIHTDIVNNRNFPAFQARVIGFNLAHFFTSMSCIMKIAQFRSIN